MTSSLMGLELGGIERAERAKVLNDAPRSPEFEAHGDVAGPPFRIGRAQLSRSPRFLTGFSIPALLTVCPSSVPCVLLLTFPGSFLVFASLLSPSAQAAVRTR